LSNQTHSEKPVFQGYYTDPTCATGLNQAAFRLMNQLNYDLSREILYLCIGTDRATGDCLGPLVGNRLKILLPSAHVFGCLEHPLHAQNLKETLRNINVDFINPIIIAVDACLGSYDNVGLVSIKTGSLSPGLALKKDLPSVGDIHIVGIVNVSGFCEHLVLQNTRLFLVYKMAEVISRALFLAQHQTDINFRTSQINMAEAKLLRL